MTAKADIRAEAERLRALIAARGAHPFETEVLQPAGALLDLYGEEIRARAFVTQDPLQGEMMLRPDFTLPLVQRHVAQGGGAARYTYAGEVFRRQEDHPDRPSEYFQVGYEVFADRDAEAEVFATFSELLSPLGLRAAMGDIGLLSGAVDGLPTTEARKAALRHHLWRPRRFKRLLDRFAAPMPDAPPLPTNEVEVGKRSLGEVEARIAALADDQATDPLSRDAVDLIDELLAVRETTPNALSRLRDLAMDMPSITAAVDRISARLDAIEQRGIATDRIDFEASYGRTSLEYYDGFVFGFYAEARPDLPPVATGGRYDALTRAVGGTVTPAVGGVIRPDIVLEVADA